MPTARGWWLFLPAVGILLLGLRHNLNLLILLGLGLLLWLGFEGYRFNWSLHNLRRRLRLQRTIFDARGPVRTLISGGVYALELRIELLAGAELPLVIVTEFVPHAVLKTGGAVTLAGRLSTEEPLVLAYSIRCPHAGIARFEGIQLQFTDLQGFFYSPLFLRETVELPILPLRADSESGATQKLPSNRLPPPGQHRLHKPGASSELLDLRDYQPGDSPRTIAWKVSARRDRLITREFESEVPLKCTLFVDTSESVRLLSARTDEKGQAVTARPLHRIADIASGVIQAGLNNRDLVGLCLVEEQGVRYQRPDRAGRHRNEMLKSLADSLRTLPEYERVDPDELLPLAHGFAGRVYPDLLHPGVNGMPFWLQWVAAFPGVWRHRVGFLRYLHRRKGTLLFLLLAIVPAVSLVINLFLGMLLPDNERSNLFLAGGIGSAVLVVLGCLGFLGVVLVTGRERRLARWRKQMAALLALRYDLGAGGLSALLEDEDALSLMLQRFLNEHQVPFRVPLYDEHGHYLHAAPGKVRVLAAALQESIRRGQDTELFVLLVDLLELDDELPPLLAAIRLARARHHQVLVVLPWPPGLVPPGTQLPAEPNPQRMTGEDFLEAWIHRATTDRLHLAYRRIKTALARLGVEVACAEEGEPVALVLKRLDRLRLARRAF